DLASLVPLIPKLLSYVLSFAYLAIYWNNHHHMLHVTHRVTGSILWANLHLLFWLSLIPFATGWMGENRFAPVPTAIYGGVRFTCALSWVVLQSAIIRIEGPGSILAKAVGRDRKGRVSQWIYIASIPLALVHPALAGACFVAVS